MTVGDQVAQETFSSPGSTRSTFSACFGTSPTIGSAEFWPARRPLLSVSNISRWLSTPPLPDTVLSLARCKTHTESTYLLENWQVAQQLGSQNLDNYRQMFSQQRWCGLMPEACFSPCSQRWAPIIPSLFSLPLFYYFFSTPASKFPTFNCFVLWCIKPHPCMPLN